MIFSLLNFWDKKWCNPKYIRYFQYPTNVSNFVEVFGFFLIALWLLVFYRRFVEPANAIVFICGGNDDNGLCERKSCKWMLF